jgi:hypothetical protein
MTKEQIKQAREEMKKPIPEWYRRKIERELKEAELKKKTSGLSLPSR